MKNVTHSAFLLGSLFVISALLGPAAHAQTAPLATRWARQLTGPADQQIWSLATDSQHNVYVGGSFQGATSFGNGVSLTNPGNPTPASMFVAKYDAQGNLLWIRQPQGGGNPQKLVVDTAGNIYVLGIFFNSLSLDGQTLTAPVATPINRGSFLAKLNSQGAAQWLQLVPGLETSGLALAGRNRLCISGTKAPEGAFVACYDRQGTALWQRSGTSQPDSLPSGANAQDLAARGNEIRLTGSYLGTYEIGNTLLPANGFNFSIHGDISHAGAGFVATLDTLGNFGWVRQLRLNIGHSGSHTGVAIGPNNETYLTGRTVEIATFDGGGASFSVMPPAFGSAAYVAAYDAQGTVQWVRTVSSPALPAQLNTHTVAVDTMGTLYVGGIFSGTIDFDSTPLSVTGPAPRSDLFLARYDRQGRFLAAQREGGPNADDYSATMAMEPGSGRVYMSSISSIFPADGATSFGGSAFTMGGITDAFFVAYDNRNPLSARALSTPQLTVAPVPAQAATPLSVSLPGSYNELRLLDATGRVVRRQAVSATDRHISFSVAGLAAGFYLLQAHHGTHLLQQRIVIE